MNVRDVVTDPDPQETREWLESLESVVRAEGAERARYLLDTLSAEAQRKGARAAFSANTAYLNTIEPREQEPIPGDQARQLSVLGTDGFGRSDTRKQLRHFFEVDRRYVAVAALKALADQQVLPCRKVAEAIEKYELDPEKPDPTTV